MKGYFLDEGGRNKDESLCVSPSPTTYFNLPYPTLPTQVKVKGWKGERLKRWKVEKVKGWKGEKVKGCRDNKKG